MLSETRWRFFFNGVEEGKSERDLCVSGSECVFGDIGLCVLRVFLFRLGFDKVGLLIRGYCKLDVQLHSD